MEISAGFKAVTMVVWEAEAMVASRAAIVAMLVKGIRAARDLVNRE
jgi:hypothetical protein